MKYRIIHILKLRRGAKRINSKTLCGKSYYGNSVMVDFSQPGPTCQVCDRISANCSPEIGCNWSWSWSRGEIEPQKMIRETAIIGNVLVTALHSRHLTRMWFRCPSDQRRLLHSIKIISKFAKTWVDTQFFRSTSLQEYLDQMFDDK